jgi:hypothetical protein
MVSDLTDGSSSKGQLLGVMVPDLRSAVTHAQEPSVLTSKPSKKGPYAAITSGTYTATQQQETTMERQETRQGCFKVPSWAQNNPPHAQVTQQKIFTKETLL